MYDRSDDFKEQVLTETAQDNDDDYDDYDDDGYDDNYDENGNEYNHDQEYNDYDVNEAQTFYRQFSDSKGLISKEKEKGKGKEKGKEAQTTMNHFVNTMILLSNKKLAISQDSLILCWMYCKYKNEESKGTFVDLKIQF